MFCPDCGASIAAGRRFCGKCGGMIDSSGGVAVAELPTREAIVPSQYLARTPYRHNFALYAVAALIAVLGGAAWWWFHRPAPAFKVEDPGIYPFKELTADGTTAKWGFIDADGNVVIQPEWDAADIGSLVVGRSVAFSEGLCGVLRAGKWGYVDTSGHLVIPNQFESVVPFVGGFARVHLGNQIGFIDKTGQYAINPQFYEAGDFHEGLAAVRGDKGWGFIDKSGIYVIKPHFQAVDLNGFSEGLAGACIDGKCGYVDHKGEFVIRPQFNNLGTFSEGLAEVQSNNKTGYVNLSGKLAINPQFDRSTMFSGGFAVVAVAGHQGTINKQGKFVVNPGQYTLEIREGGPLFAFSDGGWGLLTRDGKWILNPSKALTGIGPLYGKVFAGSIGGSQQFADISTSGKVLSGPYKGAMLDTLAQDIQNENDALTYVRSLIAAEASYSTTYPAKGFTDSIAKLGPPANGNPSDENHAGFITADMTAGNKDNYQFVISIPAGTSVGGVNFNYFIVGKPTAGHAGRVFCADSTGSVRYSAAGGACTITSPTL